ncbi:MAG: Ppx/GppA phosphatase family protein [Bacteroidota bacterium]
MSSESLAIIDLGTNTFHLLIAEVNEREDFRVREKYKEPVKLGEGGITTGKISNKAFNRGIKALKKFRKLIDSRRIPTVRAFATSAIRSASNGAEFLQRARSEAGIEIKIINGNEEAALIYEGVRNGVVLPQDEDVLIMDIGGGSVEFIVSRDGKPQLLRSLNLGAARMLEYVKPSDPITGSQCKKAEEVIMEKAAGLLEELKEFNISTIVGSSGTFETLGALVAHHNKDFLSSENLNSYRFTIRDYKQIHPRLLAASRTERQNIPGMDPMRVDMIVMGSILVNLMVRELDIRNFMVSLFALKEGILYKYLSEQRERIHKLMGDTARNLRAKAVGNLCEKYSYDKPHALKVSELALSIYDQVEHLHPFGKPERDLLKYGALLHDIGHFVNRSGHHKHGQYIVMNSGLSGFSHDEIIILGNIVRYHRKSLPTRDHFHYKVLEQKHRYLVRILAGILRIADNLDRGHRNMVHSLRLESDKQRIRILVEAHDVVDIEVNSALAQRELLEQVFDRRVNIEQVELVS